MDRLGRDAGDVVLENGGGDGYGFTAAPSGNQACIIRGTGSISQVVDFSGAGAYPLTWFGEGRGNWDLPNAIEVLLDGVQMGATITPTTTAWSSYTTILNVATAGTHTIEFLGTTTAYSGDDSTAIDNISLPTGGPLPATTVLTVAGQSTSGGPCGTFDLGGLSQTLAGLNGGGVSGGGATYGKITNSGVADAVLTVTGTGQFDGVLADGATNKLGLSVSGGGTLVLSGSNTYSGGTTVSGGTLKVANSAGSATGSGPVTVDAGATLSGSGIIGGPLEIAGELGLGDSPEILTVKNQVTFDPGSTFNAVVSGTTAGSGYDQLTTTGPVSLAGSLNVTFGAFTPAAHDMLFLINNTGAGLTTGTFQYADNSLIGTFDGFHWYITYEANDAATPSLSGGNDVAIYSVPEPTTLALLGVGAIALVCWAWRRRRTKAWAYRRGTANFSAGPLVICGYELPLSGARRPRVSRRRRWCRCRRDQRSVLAAKASCPSARGSGSSPSISHWRPVFTSSRHFDFRDGDLGMALSGRSAGGAVWSAER